MNLSLRISDSSWEASLNHRNHSSFIYRFQTEVRLIGTHGLNTEIRVNGFRIFKVRTTTDKHTVFARSYIIVIRGLVRRTPWCITIQHGAVPKATIERAAFCGHCSEYLPKTFYRHRDTFFNPVSNEWNKNRMTIVVAAAVPLGNLTRVGALLMWPRVRLPL